MIKALRQPQLKRLWLGQAFSSIGDEIYRVGLTWFAVGLMGSRTGYLVAGQTASLMLLSFIGGKWADQWNPLHTMVRVDLIRAFVVLVPVAISFFMPVPLAVLFAMALAVSALSAFFDPATQTMIPLLAKDTPTIQSTNGLMSTTIRMARMVGPAIVGLLAAIVPMIHFFTIDALTFFVSAFSVYSLRNYIASDAHGKPERASYADALLSSVRKVRQVPGMKYIFFTKAACSGTWNLALMIGFPLLIHEVTHGSAQAFGLVMASYGVGNFAGALYFGNQERTRSSLMIFSGYILLGIGFMAMGVSPTIAWLVVSAALAGFTGPMNDLAFIDLVQKKYPLADLAKIFRLRMAVEAGATLVCMLLSPTLIECLSLRGMIIFSGAVWVLTGLAGFVPFISGQKALVD